LFKSYNSIDESVNVKTDLVTNQLEVCYQDLHILFTSTIANASNNIVPSNLPNQNSEDNHELSLRKDAIQELVFQVFYQKHVKKQLILLRLITRLVNNRIIEVRYVCEYMLNNLVFAHNPNSNNQYLNILNSSQNYINTNNSNNSNNNISSLSISNNLALIHKCTQQSQNTTSNSIDARATPTYLWCKILECIRRFIPLHDYKSCRDIFKMLLEVVKRIPHSHSSYPIQLETELLLTKSNSKHKLLNDYTSGDNSLNDEFTNDLNKNAQNTNLNKISIITDDLKLESLYETINFLLDKDNYFMPRYLSINEIKTVLTFGKEPYHSRFHKIFTKFVESFIPTAHLISISGRDRLLPIVGFSNLYSLYSFWRFNQSTCKFNTSGPLPYYKVNTYL
jgi:hypothetical protein